MKIFRKLAIAGLVMAMLAGMSFSAGAADQAVGPVDCTWSDLHIDATGLLSWKMTLPEEYQDLLVQKYTIRLDIMTGGVWREDFRTYYTTETSREINYGTVGIYRFRVTATFVGGYVSTLSDYSNECSVDKDHINLNSGGSGSGSSGGPGVSGSGSSTDTSYGPGTVTKSSNDVPDWAEKTGLWFQDKATGAWYYTNNGVLYKNRWACIYNPYAKTGLGQRSYDWFCFDENGQMRTGWYTDSAGNVFYLSPVSDGSKGKMVTGWKQIDGYWYYFRETEGTGLMGALVTNTTVNGYRIDAQGRRVS